MKSSPSSSAPSPAASASSSPSTLRPRGCGERPPSPGGTPAPQNRGSDPHRGGSLSPQPFSPPREAEPGGHQSRTSCSKPPPAAPPLTMAPALEPCPGRAVRGPHCPPSPPPLPEELAGAQSHSGPTGNKSPFLTPQRWWLFAGEGMGPFTEGLRGWIPSAPRNQDTRVLPPKPGQGQRAEQDGGTDPFPLPPHPIPITEVASVPWYPLLY